MQIGIRDVIDLVLVNNLDVDASRIELQRTRSDLNAAKGAYDPTVGVETSFLYQQLPVSSILGGAADGKLRETNLQLTPLLSGLFPWGGTYDVRAVNSRTTTVNQFVPLNPQFQPTLRLEIVQPLVRGLRTDEPRRRVEISKKNISMSDEQFRQRLMDVVSKALNAYWNLALEAENLEIQMNSLDDTKRLVASIRRQAEKGIRSAIDAVESESHAATIAGNVARGKENVTRAENALKLLMLQDRSSPIWQRPLIAVEDVDSPDSAANAKVELEEALRLAFEKRPEINQSQISVETNQISTRYFQDQTRVKLDLIASYTAAGLAGTLADRGPNPLLSGNDDVRQRVNELSTVAGLTPLPPPEAIGVPPFFLGGYGQSMANLFAQRFPAAEVGLRLSLPIHNRTAKANLTLAQLEARRLGNQRRTIEMNIEAEVRNALQALRSSEEALEAARVAEKLAEEQYASERRRFDAGISTVFLVLERQSDLMIAHLRTAIAAATRQKSDVDFERAIGRTLDLHSIVITDSRSGETQYRGAPPRVNP